MRAQTACVAHVSGASAMQSTPIVSSFCCVALGAALDPCTATLAPAWASATAMPAPSPRDEPVTRAALPLRLNESRIRGTESFPACARMRIFLFLLSPNLIAARRRIGEPQDSRRNRLHHFSCSFSRSWCNVDYLPSSFPRRCVLPESPPVRAPEGNTCLRERTVAPGSSLFWREHKHEDSLAGPPPPTGQGKPSWRSAQ